MTTPGQGASRHLWQEHFLVVRITVGALLCLLLSRLFIAEPTHIPTGSMAPHRLGLHQQWSCPNCLFLFDVGIRSDGTSPEPVCPNCGFQPDAGRHGTPTLFSGDRIWVLKNAFLSSQPKRWQEVVFYAPDQPQTPHLKRVAGLPGETVQIIDGDLFVNGRRDVKQAADRRALSVLVYNQSFPAADALRLPRWRFNSGQNLDEKTGWSAQNEGRDLIYTPQPTSQSSTSTFAWVHYRHFCPARGDYGPVTDFLAYEGRENATRQPVNDLWFEADLTAAANSQLVFRLTTSEADVRIQMPVSEQDRNPRAVTVNGQPLKMAWNPSLSLNPTRPNRVEVSWVDRRLELWINHRLAFEPVELENLPELRPDSIQRDSPAAIGVRGGHLTLSGFKLYRDIYITDRPATEPVIGQAVREPVLLPPDGYFMLGDNSGFSVDSRFWQAGPVVARRLLAGTPLGRDTRSARD